MRIKIKIKDFLKELNKLVWIIPEINKSNNIKLIYIFLRKYE